MIETFSIKEEKFVDEIYYLILNVSFNKKNIFDLLETKNIFPSLPVKKDFLFTDIDNLKGVGPQLSKYLKKKRIENSKNQKE